MTRNEREIISALRSNNDEGFALLMRRYKEAIYWHIRRLVVSHDDAQDATQETFIRVFRFFERFEGNSSLAVWIYRIATNEAMRIISRKKQEQLSIDDPQSGVKSMVADEYIDYDKTVLVKLQRAILALPTKQQVAFNLRYYDDLKYDQIAQITGSTVANVKANYHVAKEKIIKYMNSTD